VAGYTTQAFFLLAAGLMDMAAEVDAADAKRYLLMSQQIKKLTLPHEMGELFKIMALTKGYEQTLMGFGLGDMRNKL
jgi:SAM-dependent MidA family methyltransferase